MRETIPALNLSLFFYIPSFLTSFLLLYFYDYFSQLSFLYHELEENSLLFRCLQYERDQHIKKDRIQV